MSVLNAQHTTRQDRFPADAGEDRMLFVAGSIILATAAALMATSIAVTAEATLAPAVAIQNDIPTASYELDMAAAEPVGAALGY